ncbi:MAG: glycosyltransferase family 2 protein [Lachnospiraceae bacterium]|nr:glycosyltransferase family 2 protein [Lachnospiraceae bacterium]
MENYNAIVLTTPTDFERLQDSYARMIRNLAPRKIVFIGSRKVQELIQQSDVEGQVGFLDEEELIPFVDVHKIMKELLQTEELPRGVTGWYYQQFLKMQYAFVCKEDYYLIWDGDTVPCKPFSMFREDGLPYLDLKQEYHEEYFHTIENLFPGMRKSIAKSFISEHMLIRCDIMKQLIGDIMESPAKDHSQTGNTFYERILYAIRPGQIMNTAFSEFETYGTYVSFRFTDAYCLRNWHSFRLGGEFFHPEHMTDEDYAWLGKDFDAISFEKGHTVREDHEEIFTSPRYREKLSARQILELAQQEFQEGYKEVWDEDSKKDGKPTIEAIIMEASRCESVGDREGMFLAIQKGLKQEYDNYELYYMLGFYYLSENIDQAYLCFQNALFYCKNEEDRATILADMENLEQTGRISVRNTAILIVSYNACYFMQRNIENIRKTLPEGSYRIVVVDNASTDGVAEWLQEQDDIVLLQNKENVGFAPACNQGVNLLENLNATDIFLLNNDTRLAPNALFWLRIGLYENEKIGAVGSCSNYAGNEQQIEVEFTLPDEYLQYGASVNVPLQEPYEERVRLSGFAMLVRGDVWEATGGMDEDFAPGYFEDDDLSMKILKAGYKLLFCKNSFIYHAGSQSFAKNSDVEQIIIDHYQLFIKKYGFDILNYVNVDQEMIREIPYQKEDAFNILQIGSGIGADLKYICTKYPKANVIGVESEAALYEISKKTDIVFRNLTELKKIFQQPVFQVLLIAKKKYGGLSREDMAVIESVCLPGCIVLPKV